MSTKRLKRLSDGELEEHKQTSDRYLRVTLARNERGAGVCLSSLFGPESPIFGRNAGYPLASLCTVGDPAKLLTSSLQLAYWPVAACAVMTNLARNRPFTK